MGESVGSFDLTELRISLRARLAYSKRRGGCPLCVLVALLLVLAVFGATPGTVNPNASAMRRARSAESFNAFSSTLGGGLKRL